ncbi:MAG: hypothetical protein ACK55I_02075, partial [bacterium]
MSVFGDLAFALLIIDLARVIGRPTSLNSLSHFLPILHAPSPILLSNHDLLASEHPVLVSALHTMHLPGIWLENGALGCPMQGLFQTFDVFSIDAGIA